MFKGLGDVGNMMQIYGKMTERMREMREYLESTTAVGEAGGGMVKATVTAERGERAGLDIDPSILGAEDKEVVEDLVVAAVREAQTKAAKILEDEKQKLIEELGLPKGMNLPY